MGGSPAASFALWPSVPEPRDYFRNKVAVVTGGASGFGRALVQDLASRGAHVVIADLDEVKGKGVAAEVEAAGGSAEAHGLDVRSLESFTELVDDVTCHIRQTALSGTGGRRTRDRHRTGR